MAPEAAHYYQNCQEKADCVGTLRTNRKNVPKKVKDKQLKKGELAGQHCGPVSVVKWKDKKVVTMISTFHGIETKTIIKRGNELIKPVSIIDYNKHMGGVDLKDQFLQSYLIERKRLNKWYMKLFRRLLNSAVLNALIIYRENIDKKVDHYDFRVELVEKLFMKYAKKDTRVPGRHSTDSLLPRLTERHFIRRIPPSGKKQHPQRRCVVCAKHSRRRDTVYFCENCDVGLCFDCFEIYHTKQNY
ncbi:hypothetical protein J437_LFUL016018 [Ladona fulva]|uniref:B box-type domain-containing protein n=1 Tax=Ladona fulva TaxID=123851 RepID=A0A8K0P6S7_LADFU|nr:hypothetical protein J437_LFUL016018 [Ladona fulva]